MDYTLHDSETFSSRFYKINLQTPKNRRIFTLRAIIMTFSISFTVFNALTAIILPDNNVECLWDAFHSGTSQLNSALFDESTTNDVLIMITSGLLDALLLYFCITWVCFGKSWRPVIAFTLFYMSRAIIQNLFLTAKPENYIWESPGIPSITASYRDSNDFFFACNCGLMMILALEFNRNKHRIPMVFCIFVGMLDVAVMLITRAHYSIDIFAGVVFGHYFWLLSGRISGLVDKKLGWRDDSSKETYTIN